MFAWGHFSLYNQVTMTFILDAQKEKPVGLFLMDDTSPLQDYTPYNRTATITGGTPTQSAPLVKGAAYAPVFTSAITAAFDQNVFVKTYEANPFTLISWVRAVATDANEQQILGNSGQMDGLTIKGTVVSFVTKFTTNGEARATYDLQQQRGFFAVGVHTDTKNSLYIDGVLVSETMLTAAQQTDTFASTSANFISGTTAGTGKIATNAVGYYPTALEGDVITRLFTVGRDVPDPETVVSNQPGDYIPMSLDNGVIFLDEWISTADDWSMGVFDNTSVISDQLVPTTDVSGVSVAGAWYKNIPIDSSGATSIYGVQLNWDGNGAVVQVSLDGTTWETVTRGTNCTTITPGYNPTNQILQMRITFPGGIANDTSYVDNLNFVGVKTAASNTVAGRTITYTGATPGRDYPAIQYHENYGVRIASGGTVVISADALTATVARTIELLIKRNGANPTLSMTGTTYINGAAGSATLPDGQWVWMHVVAAADVTGTITINGPCQVGYVGIYDTALAAGTVATIYADYTGTDAPRIADASVIGISESANAASIYQHDWLIGASG